MKPVRSLIFAVTFCLLLPLHLASQEKYPVEWDYPGESFADFVREVESRYPVRFFYNVEWISDIKLKDYGKNRLLDEILDLVLGDSSLKWYNNGHGSIILTGRFEIKRPGEKAEGPAEYIPGTDYSGTGIDDGLSGNLEVIVGNPKVGIAGGIATLSGYITDLETHEPVAGATVHIPGISAGAVSNSFGYYRLDVPRGNYTLHFSFIGMRPRIFDLKLFGNGELNVGMKSVLVPLKEAVISAEKDLMLQRMEVGVEKVNIATFRLMPSSLGEADIIKSITDIPGVNSVGEGSSGFNVRGGSADQNLILLYGSPLFNSSHLFGFFSAVNPDIIKDVTLYKGGIPVRFGGRLSSVLDIASRDGNRREFAGKAGISPVTANFVLEGPVIEDTLFYLIAGRATYSDWILGLLENAGLNKSRALFNDLNIRIAWEINRNNKIDLSAYHSFDSFSLNSDTTYRYLNNIVSLNWRHNFSNRFFSQVTLGNSYHRYGMSGLRVPEEAFRMSHRINNSSVKADFNWFPGRNELNFGSEFNRYDVAPGDFLPAGDSSLVIPVSLQRQRAALVSVYLEDKFTVTDYLTVNAGLRFSSYFALGPQTLYLYDRDVTRSESSVTDTSLFSRRGSYKSYSGPEFRLSVNLRVNTSSSVKLNYSHTRQYLHLLTNTAAISPTDTWKLSDFYLPPQNADQISAGFYRIVNRNRIEMSAEVYYKVMNNMLDFKGGTDLIMNGFIERDLVNVKGKAYGIEFLLKKPEGRIRWSLGYTWSKAMVKNKSGFKEELINGGEWFPANFDRPHDLVISASYIHSRRVSLSAGYNFSSGRPVSYPSSSYTVGNILINHYTERNSFRLPYYSRLDLSVRISGNLKSKKIAHPYWLFSVYNVTGRNNVYSAFFRNVNNTVRGYYLSVFARPIPSLSFNFDF